MVEENSFPLNTRILESIARFFLTPKMRVDHLFGIKHYAGDVEYDTRGIIEKNRDNLPQEGVDLLLSSDIPFTVLLGTIEANKNSAPKSTEASPKSSSAAAGRRGGGETHISIYVMNTLSRYSLVRFAVPALLKITYWPSPFPSAQFSRPSPLVDYPRSRILGGGGRSTIGAKSLGTQFKENLNNLLGVVNLTHPHYVR